MRRFALSLCLPFSLTLVKAMAQQAPAADLGRVEITSNRDNDTQQRRESTASKIVIGREEIEKQGDANVGEILKRMPGISVGGVPGRGGGIRMRGLSQGYTQILLDGQRVPPGFSVESLTPEMIERIEIYRAPTAETGAQAIAGTINIITREGRKGMPSELKAGASFQGAYVSPSVSYVQYQDHDKWTANYTLSVNRYMVPDSSDSHLERSDGTMRDRSNTSHYDREGMHATARLQFKGDPGESLTLMPFFALSQGSTPGNIWAQTNGASANAVTQIDNHFWVARLNGQWKRKLSTDSNMEWKFNLGGWNSDSVQTQTSDATTVLPTTYENTRIQDRSVNTGGKYTNVLGGGHQWVSGAELESVQRNESLSGQYDFGPGQVVNATGSADLRASSRRYAFYSQDEWQLTPHWSTHLGARYESLTTEGRTDVGDVSNINSIFTPLLHALWRPDPDSRDQVRASLTRSFKTPSMASLLARKTYSKDPYSPTSPDTVGNPNLKPEVATGLDVAVERYLPQGGVLSASVFYRRVQNLIRNVVTGEPLQSDPTKTVWTSRPENISDAITQGIELEAKFGLKQWIESAPAVDVRSNVSFYQSQVLSIDGPNNRLDQQPSMTMNLGADYRLRSLPLTVGGNYNYNPGYTTRSSDVQWLTVSQKRVMDVYGLWRVDNTTAWRLSLSNLAPLGYNTGTYYNSGGVSETNNTHNRSWTNVLIQLEKKL
jgi:outer membrane receptor for ferrienterochelin and colicins